MKVEIALKTYLEKRELEKIRSYYQKMGLNVNPQILNVEIVNNILTVLQLMFTIQQVNYF